MCSPDYSTYKWEKYHNNYNQTDEFVVETVVSSSEFMVDDTSARNFNDKSFGSSVVLKSPIELHNAYTAAIVLALVIFFVALYVSKKYTLYINYTYM